MAKQSFSKNSIPSAVEEVLKQLGKNIRIARLRRNLRLIDLAERLGASRYLIADIEKGKPSASIAAYVCVLWSMGLLDKLREVADPDFDTEGKALESMRAPKTAAKRRKVLDNDF